MIIHRPRKWPLKPAMGCRINSGHALAPSALLPFWEQGGGQVQEVVGGGFSTFGTHTSWAQTPIGRGASVDSNFDSISFNREDWNVFPVSCMVQVGNPTTSGIIIGSGGAGWYLQINGSGFLDFEIRNVVGQVSSLSVTAGSPLMAGFSYWPNGTLIFFANGSTVTYSFGSFGTVFSGTGLFLGGFGNTNVYNYAAGWHRPLSIADMQAVYADPYLFMQQPKQRLWTAPAAAGTFQPAWAINSNIFLGGGVR